MHRTTPLSKELDDEIAALRNALVTLHGRITSRYFQYVLDNTLADLEVLPRLLKDERLIRRALEPMRAQLRNVTDVVDTLGPDARGFPRKAPAEDRRRS